MTRCVFLSVSRQQLHQAWWKVEKGVAIPRCCRSVAKVRARLIYSLIWSFKHHITFWSVCLFLRRTKKIRRISLIFYCIYFFTSMGYVGLSLAGDLFNTDPFLYMAISGAMEIPGATFTIPIVACFGRRLSNIVLYFLTGTCLLGLSIIPTSEFFIFFS